MGSCCWLVWYKDPTQALCIAYTNMLVSKKPLVPNTNHRTPKMNHRAPNGSPNASMWNIVHIGYKRVRFVLSMLISWCCLRWVPSTNPVSDEIRAKGPYPQTYFDRVSTKIGGRIGRLKQRIGRLKQRIGRL